MRLDFTIGKQYTWGAVAVAGATAIYGGFKAANAKKEAKRLAASRPKLQESPYTQEELALTKSQLANGMSGAASNAYEQGLDRDLSTSLGTILQGGGDMNNVAELFDRSQVGRQRLALMKENLRLNNIQNYIGALRNNTVEDQNRFKFNQWAPYADQAQAVAQARQGGEQMMMSGITSAASGIAGKLSSMNRENSYNNYFNSNVQPVSQNSPWMSNNLSASNVVANNGMSTMANATPYINPNYANNPFGNNINANNFDYDNGTETPTFFQKF